MEELKARLMKDAAWLREFVRSNVGMTGHCWGKRNRAEQHEKDVAALIAQLDIRALTPSPDKRLREALEKIAGFVPGSSEVSQRVVVQIARQALHPTETEGERG